MVRVLTIQYIHDTLGEFCKQIHVLWPGDWSDSTGREGGGCRRKAAWQVSCLSYLTFHNSWSKPVSPLSHRHTVEIWATFRFFSNNRQQVLILFHFFLGIFSPSQYDFLPNAAPADLCLVLTFWLVVLLLHPRQIARPVSYQSWVCLVLCSRWPTWGRPCWSCSPASRSSRPRSSSSPESGLEATIVAWESKSCARIACSMNISVRRQTTALK